MSQDGHLEYNQDSYIVYQTKSLVVTFEFNAKTQVISLFIYDKTGEDWKEIFSYCEDFKPWHFNTLFSQQRSMLNLVANTIRNLSNYKEM